MPCTRAQTIDLAEFAVDPHSREWAEFRDHFPRCAECSQEVARFAALADALGSEGAGASAHPSDAQLLALARAPSGLARDERARLEAHIAGCAPCRTELAAARGFDFAAVAATASRRRWLEGLGMAFVPLLRRPVFAAAAAVVVLAASAGLLMWRMAREAPAAPSPPMAQVAPAAPAPVARPEPTRIAEQPAAKPESAEPAPVAERPAAAEPPSVERPPVVAKQAPAPPPVAKQPAPVAPAEAPPAPSPPAPIQIAALVPRETPIYVPRARASGSFVRVGGGTRNLGAGVPAPEALAPDQLGASTRESPNLYWFLPEATSSPVEVTVVDPEAPEPLLEATLQGPVEAGVHRVSLAEHGARLRPEVEYRWFVALVRDPARRSQDVVSGAAIRYTPPGPELSGRLSAAAPGRAAHVYAESGFWYDAFDQLSGWLAAEPDAAVLHAHRAALLEQVGLEDAAAFDRGHAPGD